MRRYGDVHLFASTTALEIFVSRTEDAAVDVCEIDGGAARTSTILARCRVKIGKNYDLIAGSDMTNADEQKAFMKFRAARGVQVVIVSPICSPFGGWSHMNRQIAHDTWQNTLDYALKLSTFCAGVALA